MRPPSNVASMAALRDWSKGLAMVGGSIQTAQNQSQRLCNMRHIRLLHHQQMVPRNVHNVNACTGNAAPAIVFLRTTPQWMSILLVRATKQENFVAVYSFESITPGVGEIILDKLLMHFWQVRIPWAA